MSFVEQFSKPFRQVPLADAETHSRILPGLSDSVAVLVLKESTMLPKNDPEATVPSPSVPSATGLRRKVYLKRGLKNLVMIPILPLSGYFLLDATGVTNLLIGHSPMMTRILGEGFGHAGLCFSLHYVFESVKYFYKGLRASR